MSYITLNDSQVRQALNQLQSAGGDLTPAMRKIAGALALITDDNFEAEGQPRWKPLADVTLANRTKAAKGKSEGGFRILQDSGQLASSVTTDYGGNHAVIGSNLAYARIQQFGGMAGRGQKVEIPARPYLPVDEDGKLQPEAGDEVLDTVMRHLRSAAQR
jgi:phage virion morphogenesis protein